METLDFRSLVSFNRDCETVRGYKIENESAKRVDGGARTDLSSTAGGAGRNRAVQLILLIGNKASGTSIYVKISIDDCCGCAGRAGINSGNNFCWKGAIRREKKQRRVNCDRAHGGERLILEYVD